MLSYVFPLAFTVGGISIQISGKAVKEPRSSHREVSEASGVMPQNMPAQEKRCSLFLHEDVTFVEHFRLSHSLM